METEVFNTDLFIDEIEKRPAIWDMTSSDYSNKTLRRRSWEELILIFSKTEDNDEKKKILALDLQKKWKSLRDNFKRELNKSKNVKSGSGASRKNSYIHFARLQFLQASVESKDTESSFDARSENTSPNVIDAELSSEFKRPDPLPKKKKPKLNPADERFADILEKSIAQRNDTKPQVEDDEDKLFCLSLYKELKKIPESRRLQTKIDIYNLVLQNQKSHQQPQYRSYHMQNYINNHSPQRRNYLTSQQLHGQMPNEGFQCNDYRTQPYISDMSNNFQQYGYTTATSSPSPSTNADTVANSPQISQTTIPHTPSPAPTNESNESELDLFCDD